MKYCELVHFEPIESIVHLSKFRDSSSFFFTIRRSLGLVLKHR